MANEQRGERELKLGGEVYTLVPSFEALVEMEQRAGCSLTALAMKFVAQNVSVRELTAVVYGGIKGGDDERSKKLTFAEVGKMVVKEGVLNLIAPVGVFMANALKGDGDPDKGEENPA